MRILFSLPCCDDNPDIIYSYTVVTCLTKTHKITGVPGVAKHITVNQTERCTHARKHEDMREDIKIENTDRILGCKKRDRLFPPYNFYDHFWIKQFMNRMHCEGRIYIWSGSRL